MGLNLDNFENIKESVNSFIEDYLDLETIEEIFMKRF